MYRIFYIVLSIFLLTGCSKTVIVSMEQDHGFDFETFVNKANRSSLILEKENIKFSVMNDDRSVYIFISPLGSVPDLKNTGPLLTFNPEKKNRFGIRYPFRELKFNNREKGKVNIRETVPDSTPGDIGIFIGDVLKERLSRQEASEIGIEAEWKDIGSQSGYFVKVPLLSTTGLPYCANPENNIFILEFTDSQQSGEHLPRGQNMPPDGAPSRPSGTSGSDMPSFGSPPHGGMPPEGGSFKGPESGSDHGPDHEQEPVRITVKLKTE